MLPRRVRLVALGLAALVFAGGVYLWCDTPTRAAAADGSVTKVKVLLRERHATLEMAAKVTDEDFKNGKVSFHQVREAKRAALNAEFDLCDTDNERVTVLKKMLAQASNDELSVEGLRNMGRTSQADVYRVKADRLEVEISLERAKTK